MTGPSSSSPTPSPSPLSSGESSQPRHVTSLDDLPPTPHLGAQHHQPPVDVAVLSEHLPPGFTAAFDPSIEPPRGGSPRIRPHRSNSPAQNGLAGGPGRASPPDANTSDYVVEDSLTLQGGDIHRDLFKLDQSHRPYHRRANTFHHHPAADDPKQGGLVSVNTDLSYQEQRLPGGFRREFVIRKQRKMPQRRLSFAARMPITRNFVEFLDLYGSFAGEDLEDSDDDDSDAIIDESDVEDGDAAAEPRSREAGERRPLLGARASSHRASASRLADANQTKAFFTLLKAFIGTGIMFLPKAFNNGGLIFSGVTMIVVSCITMLAFHLLLDCKRKFVQDGGQGGYGEIGSAIGGKRMRTLVLTSVTLSQLGFVCTGLVFVAENLASFFEAAAQGLSLSPLSLILMQLAILVPLSFIRKISKLGPVALAADVFILIGVSYIYWYCSGAINASGINRSVVWFNPRDFTLTIGSSIFTFEGIGLILPIEASMREPAKFERLLFIVMVLITVLYTSVGALCYATFGAETRIEVISNFPQDSKLVNAVQFFYALAVLFGNPVQLFPALRILEARAFGIHKSGARSWRTKWKKNAFRTVLLLFCAVVALLGASNLDRFVALIGSVACVPLVYVYPPYLHYIGVASTRWEKGVDIGLMTIGVIGMVLTTTITVVTSFL